MLKKVLALLLAVVMCLSVLTACGGSGKKRKNTSNAQAQVTLGGDWENPLFPEVVSFDIFMPANDNYHLNDLFLRELLKANENIDVTWEDGASFQEQFALRCADHTVPEITWSNSSLQWKTYGPVGALLDFSKYLDKMPNLKAVLEQYPEAKDAFTSKLPDHEGSMWAVPCIQEADTDAYAFIYREDVFKKLNMEWPTTQDGFYNALKTLKANYPKSYPLVFRQMTGNMQGFIYWLPSWGTSRVMLGNSNLFKLNADGTCSYDPVNQGMKECLTFMNKLYDEGLLHPDLLTLTSNEWSQTFATETSFVGWDKMDRIAIQLQPAGEAAGIDGFKLVAGAPIAFGSNGVAATIKGLAYGSYCFMVAASVEKDEIRLNQILAYIDWLYSEEGIITTNWGSEGVTWEKDAEGNIKFLDSLLAENDPQYSRGMGIGSTYGVKLWDAYRNWLSEDDLKSLELAVSYATLEPNVDLTDRYTDDERKIFETYSTALFSNTGNGLQSFIVGAGGFDIEKDWDTWVAKITGKSYRYADLKKIHEAAYARIGK